MTTTCTGCGKYLALIPNGSGPLVCFDYEPDGYTPSAHRHICTPIGYR